MTRGTRTLLTDPDADEVWREVDLAVRAYLARRRVPVQIADDVVQETAARALSNEVAYEDAADLTRWCRTVAARLAVDHFRSGARFAPEMPDVVAVDDVARMVEVRLAVDRVRRALAGLEPDDRAQLLAALAPTPEGTADRTIATRLAVRRHRARRRLLRISGAVWGGLPLGAQWVRRLRPVAPVAVAATAVAVTLFVVPDIGGSSTRPPQRITFGNGETRAAAWSPPAPRPTTVPRPAPAPAVRARTPGRPSRPAATPVPLPRQVPAYVERRPRNAHDSLVCVDHAVVVEHICLG